VTDTRAALGPQPDWTLYYADWFLARYSVTAP